MSSDAQQLSQLINQMSTPNDQVIRDTQQKIRQASESNPDLFVKSLLEILAGDFDKSIKLSTCIWLQKALSPYQDALPNVFLNMSAETREHFKQKIFQVLIAQTDKKVAMQIADTIGEIGGGVVTDDSILKALNTNDPWPDLFVNSLSLFDNGSEIAVEGALRIINNITLYGSHKYVNHTENIKAKLQACMESGSIDIKVKAAEVVGSLVATLPVKYVKNYLNFAVPMMKVTDQIIFENQDIDSGSKMLETFSEIIETEPKFFKKNFNDLVDLMSKIRSDKNVEVGIKNQCIEIIISISQRYPEVLKEDSALLTKVVEMVFTQMLEIPDDVTEEWMNPPDGFNEDDDDLDDQNVCKFCMDCIDRLLSHVGPKIMLPFLSDCIQKLLGQNNWKMTHAAFMALSQIGEYMGDKPEEVAPIVDKIGTFINHENPRIRYACCHAIGQLADDLAPDFQMLYHDKVMTMLSERLQDPVPRVLGHACASLTNHLEQCNDPKTQIAPLIGNIFSKLWDIMENGSCFVREHALSAISALSVGAGSEYFLPFYDDNMNKLLSIIENYQKDEFKKLRGHAIECASITSKSVGKEKFTPYCGRLVTLMMNIQNQINCTENEEDDPQMAFLLSAWQRISGVMKDDFYPFLDQLMPSLLTMCKSIINNGKKYENENPLEPTEEEPNKQKFNAYEDDNCFVAMNMIKMFLKRCGSALAKHVKDIYEVIVPLMDYLPNESVREIACSSLPNLVLALKGAESQENIALFSKTASAKLWATMDNETEVEILLNHAKAMQKLIQFTGEFLDNAGLEVFYNKCIDHLTRSDQRKQQTDEHKDEDDFDEDVEGVLEMEKTLENEFHCQIAEIFGRLFMTHKERTLPIAAQLDAKFICTSLQDSQPPRLQKFGLFLIDDIIDNLGDIEEVRKIYFEKYYNQLIKFSTHPVIYVRHAACYGLGAMAKCVKGDFYPLFEATLQKLKEAIEIPQNTDTSLSLFNSFSDNAKSAFGKILEAVMEQLNTENQDKLRACLKIWLTYLPIKHDQDEAIIQHNLLLKIVTHQEDLLIQGEDAEAVKQILDTFISIYAKESAGENRNQLMKQILSNWAANPTRKATIDSLNLDTGVTNQLKAIMEAAN